MSRQHIPRGCRKNYIPGLNKESSKTKAKYEELFKHNPFSEETIKEGEKLSQLLHAEKNRKWHETIENIDMPKNSKKAWRFMKKLNGDPTAQVSYINVNANQVASELLRNGKPNTKIKKKERLKGIETQNVIISRTTSLWKN